VSAAGSSDATPAAGLQLEVVAGNAAGTVIGVEERLVFGRQSEGTGQLADDPELSRHHAEITRRPTGEHQLEDLASTNGTYVNGTRLQAPVVLSLGDTIELGTTKLVVRTLAAAVPPAGGAIDVRAATAVTDVPAAASMPHVQREPTPAAPPPQPTPPPPPPPPPPLELRLRVDLEREEAEIALDRGQSVRFRLQDGCWQIVDGDPR
jgi:predicted component of type VI protein secretion system